MILPDRSKEIETLMNENEGLQRALANMQNEIERLENQLKQSQEDKEFLLIENIQSTSKNKSPKFRLSLWIGVLASSIAFSNSLLNFDIPFEELLVILMPLIIYMVIEGIIEISQRPMIK